MEKNYLKDYTDACALIKETERDLLKLKRNKALAEQNCASGFSGKYGYVRMGEGGKNVSGNVVHKNQADREQEILEERKKKAEGIKADVEAWMNMVPARLQRIIRYKFFEGLSWEETAVMIGRQATGESVKKEFQRFMKEN